MTELQKQGPVRIRDEYAQPISFQKGCAFIGSRHGFASSDFHSYLVRIVGGIDDVQLAQVFTVPGIMTLDSAPGVNPVFHRLIMAVHG